MTHLILVSQMLIIIGKHRLKVQDSNLNHVCFHNSWLRKIPFAILCLETAYTSGTWLQVSKEQLLLQTAMVQLIRNFKIPSLGIWTFGNSIVQTSVRQAEGNVKMPHSNFAKHSEIFVWSNIPCMKADMCIGSYYIRLRKVEIIDILMIKHSQKHKTSIKLCNVVFTNWILFISIFHRNQTFSTNHKCRMGECCIRNWPLPIWTS